MNLDGNHDLVYNSFNDLINEVNEYISKSQNFTTILEAGAKCFVNDLLKLPKPYSKIRKSGYTHLVDTFTYKKNKTDIEVGWGKYYGRMVEDGTKKMKSQPHMYPLFEKNKEKYYKKMLENIYK